MKKKQNEIKLMTDSQRDELTGVYHRSTFKAKVLLKTAKANEDLVNVFIMVGVDKFKRINDKYGYVYGDKVLRDIARTMRLVINEEDIIGRFGGTKFLIYMHNKPDKETTKKTLDLIQIAVSKETEDSAELSLSMGTVLYGQDGREFNELYEKAYIALAYAKETGGNKIVEYKEGLQELLKGSQDKEVAKEGKIINKKRVDIRTFSYFDVFIDGQAVLIPHGKAKELLALLTHRRGAFVTPQEIIAHLWENEECNKVTLARCRKAFMLLKDTLKKYDVEAILESNMGARRVIPEKINCDLYNYLSGEKEYSHLYNGYYMLNYSWSEFAIAELEEQARKYKNKNKK